jgi:diaminobutyrate-2-oxoglutarate transaminase
MVGVVGRGVPDERESRVAAYSRRWPTVFQWAQGSWLRDVDGVEYLDFFAGAGSLNYGHNHPALIGGLIDYLQSGGPLCSLDMATSVRSQFLDALDERLLGPRGMSHRVQFTSPSGAAAVEAALRLARKATGWRRVVSLAGAFHGMSLDAISVSDGAPRSGRPTLDPSEYCVVAHEADVGLASAVAALDEALTTGEPVAAVIVETVQAEGGVRALSGAFLTEVERLCRETGTVFVVDDIQVGCGRTGPFFSFEEADVRPDLVCLSKSLSAGGLPLSVVLVDPLLDIWSPGEHSGTFRGNDLAFVTATIGLERWWSDDVLSKDVARKGEMLLQLLDSLPQVLFAGSPRGRGLLVGLPCRDGEAADAISRGAFDAGLLVETCGVNGEVLKLSPPLTVTDDELERAVAILSTAVGLSALERRATDV